MREGIEPVIAQGKGPVPAGYRRAGSQAIRVDMAEKLFRAAHELRSVGGAREFRLDPALATSMGLQAENFARLMRDAGFTVQMPRKLAKGTFGPPAPPHWRWRPPRKDHAGRGREGKSPPPQGNAFSALAGLLD
jgi:ATP-dependent RNA helicase SUPV3L1/SUV3